MTPNNKPRSIEGDLIQAGVEIQRTEHGTFTLRRGARVIELRTLQLTERNMSELGLIGARANPGRATLNH